MAEMRSDAVWIEIIIESIPDFYDLISNSPIYKSYHDLIPLVTVLHLVILFWSTEKVTSIAGKWIKLSQSPEAKSSELSESPPAYVQ